MEKKTSYPVFEKGYVHDAGVLEVELAMDSLFDNHFAKSFKGVMPPEIFIKRPSSIREEKKEPRKD